MSEPAGVGLPLPRSAGQRLSLKARAGEVLIVDGKHRIEPGTSATFEVRRMPTDPFSSDDVLEWVRVDDEKK